MDEHMRMGTKLPFLFATSSSPWPHVLVHGKNTGQCQFVRHRFVALSNLDPHSLTHSITISEADAEAGEVEG